MYRIGSFEFDPRTGALKDSAGAPVELRPQTTEVLKVFAGANGGIVSKAEVMDRAWSDVTVSEDSLYQCIAEIRRALSDDDRKLLVTVPRKGYRLIATQLDGQGSSDSPAASATFVKPSISWRIVAAIVLLAALVIGGWMTQRDTEAGVVPGLSVSGLTQGSEAAQIIGEELRVVWGATPMLSLSRAPAVATIIWTSTCARHLVHRVFHWN